MDTQKKIHRLAAVVFLATLLLTVGCAFLLRLRYVSESRIFPRKPDFSVTPQTVADQDNCAIDFSAVYMMYDPYTNRAGEFADSYNFIRFWPTGQMYGKGLGYFPTREDVESFEHAWLGFYEISGTNIVMETYWGEYYIKTWGVVSPQRIRVFHAERRTRGPVYKGPVDEEVYERFHFGNLTRQPDWTITGMVERVEAGLEKR